MGCPPAPHAHHRSESWRAGAHGRGASAYRSFCPRWRSRWVRAQRTSTVTTLTRLMTALTGTSTASRPCWAMEEHHTLVRPVALRQIQVSMETMPARQTSMPNPISSGITVSSLCTGASTPPDGRRAKCVAFQGKERQAWRGGPSTIVISSAVPNIGCIRKLGAPRP